MLVLCQDELGWVIGMREEERIARQRRFLESKTTRRGDRRV